MKRKTSQHNDTEGSQREREKSSNAHFIDKSIFDLNGNSSQKTGPYHNLVWEQIHFSIETFYPSFFKQTILNHLNTDWDVYNTQLDFLFKKKKTKVCDVLCSLVVRACVFVCVRFVGGEQNKESERE